ncbi:MAG TPA: hypothetical protein VNF07_10785 [Acidimicrobiales bacterium]|nr:hypothetical protein [Acidimicrobiales bacterium]
MEHSHRWVGLLGLSACVVGAVGALSIVVPRANKTAAVVVVRRPAATSASRSERNATQAVIRAANGLTVSIANARTETATVLATSFAALARSQAAIGSERSQLAAEQRQIVTETEQLAARAAALSAEGVTLQRESAVLKAAQARAAAQASAVATRQQVAPSAGSSYGGDHHDD